jgi:hypothetical protein
VARQILRFLGTRYGIALVLFVLVMGVVAIARAASGPVENDQLGPPPPVTTTPATASAAPTASTTGTVPGDDGVADSEGPLSPSSLPGMPAPDAVAVDFARAWLTTDGRSNEQWLKGMEPYATRNLLDKLKGVDPTEVPANAIRGPARVTTRDALLVEVSVPVQPGTLILRVLGTSGRWLVDGVNWERP